MAVGAALYLAVKPYLVIDPKLAQTAGDLAFVFNLKQWTIFVVPALLLIGLAMLVILWRNSKWWTRLLAVVVLAPAVFATWLVNANPFEMMFSPLKSPEFAQLEAVDFLTDEDIVLAVTIKDEAVAYPLRQLAHHHIVHDVVGGVPIVATY